MPNLIGEGGGRARRESETTSSTTVVEFLSRHEVFPVPHLDDLSDDELSARWLLGPDFDAFQRDIIKTVRDMRRGRVDESSPCPSTTARGLEHLKSAESLEQRKINRDCVTQALLEEQERQRSAGGGAGRDVDELRRASEHASLWARELARAAAEEDAAFVEEERRTARAALRSIRVAKRTTRTAATMSTTAEKGLVEKASSKQCLTVLEEALELSEARSHRSPGGAGAADAAAGRGPVWPAVVEKRTSETEKVESSVAIRQPKGSSSRAAAAATSNSKSSSGSNFLAKFRSLKTETVSSPQAAMATHPKLGGLNDGSNEAMVSLRTVLMRQQSN